MYMYVVLYQGGGCGKQIAREGGVKIILTWNDVQKHGIMFKRKSQLMQYRYKYLYFDVKKRIVESTIHCHI